MADGHELLLADTAEELADGVRRVLADDDLADRLGSTGRRFAEAFGWPVLAARFADLVLDHGRRPS